MKNFLKILVIFVIALFITIVLFRNSLVARVAELAVRTNTNMTMDIARMQVGILRPVLDIDGLAVYGPQGFDHTAMLSFPDVYVSYVPSSLLPGKTPHLREVRLHLGQVALIRNQYGQLNVESLEIQGKPVGPGAPKEEQSQRREAGNGKMDLIIDTLFLRVDRLMYIDYSGGQDAPEVQVLNVRLNQTFTNVTDPQAFITNAARLITQKAAGAGLEDVLSRELGRLGEQATKEAGRQFDDIERAGEAAEDIVEEGKKTLEDAARSFKDLLPSGRN